MIPQTFIFGGPSGSGKGTQAALLAEHVKKKDPARKQFHFYTGDGFRRFIETEGYSNKLCRDIQVAGGLQPEFLAIYLWADSFIKNISGGEHFFIDGSPRKSAEAAALDSALQFYGREKPYMIVVNVSLDESRRRLLARGRHDDTNDAIARRLGWYVEFVVPAINFFRNNPRYSFIEVNGEQEPEKVHEDIIKKLTL